MFTVFIVDDEELIVNQIKNDVPWMENGFEVIGTQTDAIKALELIKSEKPDVVFSDLKMPNLDGHALMKAVRDSGMETEFVMLSAYGTFEDAKTFFMQEGFDYILKPLQLQEVDLVLERLANRLSKKYPQKVEPDDTINPAFAELVEYVSVNFRDKFTLEQLSRKFGLSAGYICNLFAKHYNTTLTCFVTEQRMKMALNLMQERKLSLKSIAAECGYKDYFYFNRVFKGYYGTAPSKYFEELKNE